jgi:excisionase family DNA binding protein
MNKQEAADYLGVSTKTIERYVQKGELPAKYVQGKTRACLQISEFKCVTK